MKSNITPLTTLLSPTNCPDLKELKAYAENSLSSAELRQIELHLAECTMCNDELEGLLLIPASVDMNSIARRLNNSIAARLATRTPFYLSAWFKTGMAAASLLLVVTFAWYAQSHFFSSESDMAQSMSSEDAGAVSMTLADTLAPDMNNTDVEIGTEKNETETVTSSITAPGVQTLPSPPAVLDVLNIVADDEEISYEDLDMEIAEEAEDEVVVLAPEPDGNLLMPEAKDVASDLDLLSRGRGISETETDDFLTDLDENKNEDVSTVAQRASSTGGAFSRNSDKKNERLSKSAYSNVIPSDWELQYANDYYSEMQYDSALFYFMLADAIEPLSYANSFSKAMCLYYTHDYRQAVPAFDKLITKTTGVYYEDCLWYSALSCINLNDTVKAKQLLNKVIALNKTLAPQAKLKLDAIR